MIETTGDPTADEARLQAAHGEFMADLADGQVAVREGRNDHPTIGRTAQPITFDVDETAYAEERRARG